MTAIVDMVIFNVGAAFSVPERHEKFQSSRAFQADGYEKAIAEQWAYSCDCCFPLRARRSKKSKPVLQLSLHQRDPRLHFGLAGDSVMDKVEIRWPNGNIETLRNVSADAIYTVVEGQGIKGTIKLPPPASH